MQLTGITTVDPAWLYGIGWAVVVTALVFIFVVGIFTATKQEEYYTFQDVSSSLGGIIIDNTITDVPIFNECWLKY